MGGSCGISAQLDTGLSQCHCCRAADDNPWLLFTLPGCREVQKAVNTAQGLFQRWTELLQDPSIATREEIDWTTNELRNNLRSIEWDLEDLDETINILSVVFWR